MRLFILLFGIIFASQATHADNFLKKFWNPKLTPVYVPRRSEPLPLTKAQKEIAKDVEIWKSLDRNLPPHRRSLVILNPLLQRYEEKQVGGLFPNGDFATLTWGTTKIERVSKDEDIALKTETGRVNTIVPTKDNPTIYEKLTVEYKFKNGDSLATWPFTLQFRRLTLENFINTNYCTKSSDGIFSVGDSVALKSQQIFLTNTHYFGKIVGVFSNGDYALQMKSFHGAGPHVFEKFQAGQHIIQDPDEALKEYGFTPQIPQNAQHFVHHVLRISTQTKLELVERSRCQ